MHVYPKIRRNLGNLEDFRKRLYASTGMSTSHLWSNSEGKNFFPNLFKVVSPYYKLSMYVVQSLGTHQWLHPYSLTSPPPPSIYSTAHFPRQAIITSLDPLILGSKTTQEVPGAGASASTAISLIVAVLL